MLYGMDGWGVGWGWGWGRRRGQTVDVFCQERAHALLTFSHCEGKKNTKNEKEKGKMRRK